MHSRDGHVPELQWEVMSSNEASTGPPVSLQLLFHRHITYDGLRHMLDMLDNFLVKFNCDTGSLPVELRLIGTGQTTAGPTYGLQLATYVRKPAKSPCKWTEVLR